MDDLTVEENLTLGKERHLAGFIWRSSDGRGEGGGDPARLGRQHPPVDAGQGPERGPETAHRNRQGGFHPGACVLIMDEPTAALSEDKV